MKLSYDTPLPQRRKALRDQIVRRGPEHFDMVAWYRTSDGGRELALRVFAGFDIDDCGSTACLAGHGLLLMPQPGADAVQVAGFYGLPVDAFHRELWDFVAMPVGWGRMSDEYALHAESDRRQAEHATVVEYLNELIAAGEADD